MRKQLPLILLGVALLGAAAYIIFLLSPNSPLRTEASAPGIGQVITPALVRVGTVVSRNGLDLTLNESGIGSSTVKLQDNTPIRVANSQGSFESTDIGRLTQGDIVSVNLISLEGQTLIQSIDIVLDK